jgi:hypothetical protein
MSVRAAFPAIAIVACSLVLPLAAPESAGAEACLTAPKGQAPGGSHWYYRLERPSMRKCWRLVAQQEESGAARTASRSAKHAQKPAQEIVAQGDVEDETEAAPAPNPPPVRTAPPQPATAQAQPPQSPVINNWTARDTSTAAVSEAPLPLPLPLPPPAPSAEAAPRADTTSVPIRLEQTAPSESAPAVITERPLAQRLAKPSKSETASDADVTSMLRLLPAILALLGLAGAAVFYVTRVMRRRSDVLTVTQDADALEAPVEAPRAPDAATFAPLPPLGTTSREDDVDEALRRFAENWKRRAA